MVPGNGSEEIVIARMSETAIIDQMRQIITRVGDDLHARLKERAAAEKTSLNALVVEALEAFLEHLDNPHVRLERRAKRLGIKFVEPPPGTPPFDAQEFRRFVESLPPGLGPIFEQSLAEDREDDEL